MEKFSRQQFLGMATKAKPAAMITYIFSPSITTMIELS